MTPVSRMGHRLGVPKEGYYQEILNSDAQCYGGSGVGNFGGRQTERASSHRRPFSLSLNLPPLGVCYLKWEETPHG